jgi:hypothetical protein
VEGVTLKGLIDERGVLTINQSLDLLEQIAGVLVRQEALGIVHRDIKPNNIIFRDSGAYCLIDYGLVGFDRSGPSKILGGDYDTVTGIAMGTPAYMPPEQALNSSIADIRSDIFSLGATLWHCLSGRPPRAGENIHDILKAAQQALPPIGKHRSGLPESLSRIIGSMTAVAPSDRYTTASELVKDVQRYRYGKLRSFGATKGAVFVAIPFSRPFNQLFDFLQDVCGEAGLAAHRIDRVASTNGVWDEIDKDIRLSKIVIAVFTRAMFHRFPNPNVLTEAAHAKALGKPLIVLTTDRAEDLPFDWRHLSIIRYSNTLRGRTVLREELVHRLLAHARQA